MPFSFKDIVAGGALPDSPPEGYIAKFDSIEPEVYSPKTGGNAKPRLVIKGKVVMGELAERKFVIYRYLTAGALGFLKTDLTGAGLPEDYEFIYSPLENFKEFAKELRGILLGGRLFCLEAKLGKAQGRFPAKTEYRIMEPYGTPLDEIEMEQSEEDQDEYGLENEDGSRSYESV
jgi:hypothetical protein